MVKATNLGYPRIGGKREMKRLLERFWSGKIDQILLDLGAQQIRQSNWQTQQEAGIEHIPSNDFSYYDHVLDTAALVGAVPARFNWTGETVDLATYFAMARGRQASEADDVPAMEMTKWFDTNYHYIVPEFEAGQQFRLASSKPVDEFLEAKAAGILTRPVLLGPVSFLLLGKAVDGSTDPLTLLPSLLPIYAKVLSLLAQAGAEWVQIDEPTLVMDLSPAAREAFRSAYRLLAESAPRPRVLVATYFASLGDNLQLAADLPVEGLHIDLVRAPDQLEPVLVALREPMVLSLGLVDGRNVWRTDLDQALSLAQRAVQALGSERVFVGPSSSLLHVPIDVDLETHLGPIHSWLAFAKQKLDEIHTLVKALNEGVDRVSPALETSRTVQNQRRTSAQSRDEHLRQRLENIPREMLERQSEFPERRLRQQERLRLPLFPTTTIGSFPQTNEVRQWRARLSKGEISAEEYQAFIKEQIQNTIAFQEEAGLDVLVHGEFERSDMVQFFGERLTGFAFTQHGWVQSFGSRYVRPPIIFGDVSRPEAMTVTWSRYAQSLSKQPVKGMLTGPVTILQWSFVRDDQPRPETCKQIALAIRDEVLDLESAGIGVIQIDEPALREGLPLQRADWQAYLEWAVDCFRLASAGVRDETQIHTHMCYSEFNDIIEHIAAMDADVISIEASRSRMELLDAFAQFHYPNEIGPGVYDIHSPRVPSQEEMEGLLRRALEVLSPDQLWVNPDCGLKTRSWDQVRPALLNLVNAARTLREEQIYQ